MKQVYQIEMHKQNYKPYTPPHVNYRKNISLFRKITLIKGCPMHTHYIFVNKLKQIGLKTINIV